MARDLLLGASGRSWARDDSGADPLVWTPSAVRAELSRVRDLLDLANQEVSRAAADGKISSDEWSTWRRTYQTGHRLVDRASPLWGSNVAAARQHAAEALRWRELVRERGAAPAGPRDAGRPADDGPRFTKKEFALLAVGGTAALAMLVRSLRK